MAGHRIVATATALALCAGGIAALAGPANADTSRHDSRAQQLRVNLNADGSAAAVSRHEVHPGVLTLRVRAGTMSGASLTVVSLRDGVQLSQFLADLTTAASGNAAPADVIAAITEIDKTAVTFGGADTLPGGSVADTIELPRPGTYYLISTAGAPAVSVATIEARGRRITGTSPRFTATVTLGDNTRDVITTSGRLPAHGTIRVRNNGDVIHLLQMTKVAAGVTDEQVQAEYDQLLTGQQLTSDPAGLTSAPSALVGSDAVSPGRSDRLSYDVPAGTYLLQCFVPDDMTGLPHAFMGMHKVVVIG